MHIELTPEKLILIIPLEIVVLEICILLLYRFTFNMWEIRKFAALDELNKY